MHAPAAKCVMVSIVNSTALYCGQYENNRPFVVTRNCAWHAVQCFNEFLMPIIFCNDVLALILLRAANIVYTAFDVVFESFEIVHDEIL